MQGFSKRNIIENHMKLIAEREYESKTRVILRSYKTLSRISFSEINMMNEGQYMN